MQLSLLIWIPLLTALILLWVPPAKARLVACLGAAVQLVTGMVLLVVFLQARSAGNNSQMLFESRASWFTQLSVQFHFGVDGTAVAMILLTALVVLSGILVSWTEKRLQKEFFFLLTLLSMGAYGFFISLNLFTFFFFLEIAVIPKFLLIGIWGSGRKEYSAMKLALMLMAGSALVFLGLVGVYYHSSGSFDMLQIQSQALPPAIQRQVFPFLFLGFGIFAAIFPFHTWVPDGHASAPTAASMFLAGISMKLGGYGCLRVATMLMPDAAQAYSWIIVLLSTIAIVYGAFATMMQKDLKYINAYSSVSHCGFVLLGIGMMTPASINGAVLQMISHGLMTALFFAAIGMIYSRTHTRMTAELGGLLKVMPFASTVFVLAGLCSLGLPGLSGFVAEMTVFMGAWQRPEMGYHLATILSCASIVITAVYILRAAGKVIMGPIQEQYLSLPDAYWYERTAAILLIAAILVMGLAPFWIQDIIGNGLAQTSITVLPK
ncbi:MAG TPA: NADH-quinone oxidoreductase subunit M [Sediminibacterium sp.]|nr:NADH-quinone oxidoreductase subunit M [Sediminibacterium sp.]